MHIKMTTRYHLTPVKSGQHKQIHKQMLKRMQRKGNPSILLVGMQTGASTVKTVWNFLWKLEMELPFNPAIPLLGLYPKNPETPIQKNLCTPMFIAAQFTIAKYWKQPKCLSANEWVKKLWYIYTMEFYAAERKKELIPFAMAWMELESIMLSDHLISKTNGYCSVLSIDFHQGCVSYWWPPPPSWDDLPCHLSPPSLLFLLAFCLCLLHASWGLTGFWPRTRLLWYPRPGGGACSLLGFHLSAASFHT